MTIFNGALVSIFGGGMPSVAIRFPMEIYGERSPPFVSAGRRQFSGSSPAPGGQPKLFDLQNSLFIRSTNRAWNAEKSFSRT